MKLAPVLLFAYKRLEPLVQTVEALSKNILASESDIFVFSDGPKKQSDEKEINEVREFIKTISGFKSITIKESKKNKGLANSIISGVSEVMKMYDRVIVLEDDLLTTSNFLMYMNKSLNKYENEANAFSISGYSFNLHLKGHFFEETYFLHRGWSWGWGTWRDRWEKVDWSVADYNEFKTNKEKRKEFSRGGSDLNKMLDSQMNGTLDSWAIRWFYHQYKVKGLTLFPVYSKVYNNGFDKYATHTTGSNRRYLPLLDSKESHEIEFPKNVSVQPKYQRPYLKKMGIMARILSKVETLIFSIVRSK